MTDCARPPHRRPLAPAGQENAEPLKAPVAATAPAVRAPIPTAPPPVHTGSIPRFMVLPADGPKAPPTAESTGAHRFPTRPTPVLGAAVGLLGYAGLESACRPWRRRSGQYRCARITARNPSGRDARTLSSARFPKV